MEIKRGKPKSLYSIFLTYLISFFISTIILMFVLLSLLMITIKSGVILPANYSERQIEAIKGNLIEEGIEGANKIPYPCQYVFYNNEGQYVKGNADSENLENFNRYLKGEKFNSNYLFTKINSKSGIYVIRYDFKAHFLSPKLNRIFPTPEDMLFIVFFILFIILSIIISIMFGKKLKKELYPLKLSTEKIKNEDLDFTVKESKVKEFNDVLSSISDMKEELKKSLESQWKAEEERRDQVVALAHDIKTPLTIIKGNTELLKEGNIEEEDKEFLDYILKNTNKIENYLGILMEVSKAEGKININKSKVNSSIFIKNLEKEFDMLAKAKNLEVLTVVKDIPEFFYIDKELLERAIMNIITNAICYSKDSEEIKFIIESNEGKIGFIVEDSGEGFTGEALEKATNKFYMDYSGRQVGKHYGMGLYIAKEIAEKHGGFIEIENKKNRGAKVSLFIEVR